MAKFCKFAPASPGGVLSLKGNKSHLTCRRSRHCEDNLVRLVVIFYFLIPQCPTKKDIEIQNGKGASSVSNRLHSHELIGPSGREFLARHVLFL